MEKREEHHCHGGVVGYYTHDSAETKTPMNFSVFTPPKETKTGSFLIFLSGLTCTEDNFTVKAGAYKKASELGLTIIAPDTSPRGKDVPDDESYAMGQGAGFYIDATQAPWNKNFRMESYIIKELIPSCEENFGLNKNKKSIMGHSMGGHGALTLYLKYPDMFSSCSAFAPIVSPTTVPWGRDIFKAYLGDDETQWKKHDATEIVKNSNTVKNNAPILIDQGLCDDFLEKNLKPHLFENACKDAGQEVKLQLHDYYDHGYFFIQSFIENHLEWHKKYL